MSMNTSIYNNAHNILTIFDVLPNFPFTTSETNAVISSKHGMNELPHKQMNNLRLKIFILWMIVSCYSHTFFYPYDPFHSFKRDGYIHNTYVEIVKLNMWQSKSFNDSSSLKNFIDNLISAELLDYFLTLMHR